MASVRMTNELRYDIRRNAENAYDLANPEPRPSTEYVNRVRQAIEKSPVQKFLKEMAELGEERGLKELKGENILPRPNNDPITGVVLRRVNINASHYRDYEQHTINFTTQMHKYFVTEETYNRYGKPNVYIEDLADEDRLEVDDLFDKLEADHNEWRTSRQNYERSIRDLLDNVTTLKQLLEVWPAAESLVPPEKIQKMHTKENRKQQAKRVREEINFDPTVANQAVLTAKMLGG